MMWQISFCILVLCLSTTRVSAWTRVQVKDSTYAGSSAAAITFTSTPAVNNLIIVTVGGNGTGTTAVTITDNQAPTNTYTQAGTEVDDGGGNRLYLFYAIATRASGTFIVTSSAPASSSLFSQHIAEYSGNATTSFFDQTNQATGTSTAIASGNITTGTAGELYVAAQVHENTLTTTVGAGWGNLDITTEDAGSFVPLATEDQLGPAAGTYNGTFTISSSSQWAGIVASFKPSGGVTSAGAKSKKLIGER